MNDDDFEHHLGALLERRFGRGTTLDRCERLSGGASQETYRIEATIDGRRTRLALRRAAGGAAEEHRDYQHPGLETEALLMRAAREAGVPEPEIYAILEPADGLGAGFLMQWLDGETLGARIVRDERFDAVRPRLAAECGRILARIHAIDLDATGLRGRLATITPDAFVRQVWASYRSFDTPQPMIDYTARWLLDHLPAPAPPCLVHNDFRNGNLMIDDTGVTAVLDWEVAHVGDPVRDIGWICTNSWRFGESARVVGGFGDLDDLLDGYAEESGRRVDPAHVRFWIVFGSFWWASHCLLMFDRYRNGPDRSVERPGIGRRTSECQMDCVNLLIPGPVELVAPQPEPDLDMPRTEELVASVCDFLRGEVMDATQGRTRFMARVAANSLDIALRDARLGGPARAAEADRLGRLLGTTAPLTTLRWELTERLRDGSLALDHPGLAEHLRLSVANQLAIDQPKYSALQDALAAAN